MIKSGLRLALCGGLIGAICAIASPASAVLAGPNPSDFQITESCDPAGGCSGTFDLINNSSSWYIWAFEVGNPTAITAGTTQLDWSAGTCQLGLSCVPLNEDEFQYNNIGGALDFAHDIGPGVSSNLFTFNSLAPASPYSISLVDANDDLRTVTGTTSVPGTTGNSAPEPLTLSIFGAGLAGAAAMRRRKAKA